MSTQVMTRTNNMAAKKLSYDAAQEALLVDFQKRFLPEDESEFEQDELDAVMLSIGDNSNVLKELILKHITPIYKKALLDNTAAKNAYQKAATAAAAAATVESAAAEGEGGFAVAKKKGSRRLSNWQIYLTYASKLIPGYKESNRKIGLCKEHYKLLTEDEIKELCDKYMVEHPSVPLAMKGRGNKIPAKRGGTSGYSLFSKEWYDEQKKQNSEVRGLQSKACGLAWKNLTDQEREAYNNRANESKRSTATSTI